MAVNFSGGDTLKPENGLSYYLHKTMMVNELRGGKGAYEMSDAKNASSGPSFGPFQYDVGSNNDGRALLESIAKNAKDTQGQRYINNRMFMGGVVRK